MAVKRQHILVFLEAIDSNINGDPDAENAPRIDPDTQQGLVSDVCLKRKIRDYIALEKGTDNIYVKQRGVLASEHEKAYKATGQKPGTSSNALARQYMCENYIDVRTFGALMTGGKTEITEEDGEPTKKHKAAKNTRFDCGAVRGPVQLSFARSIDPISTLEHTITRVALTNKTDGGGATENEDGSLTANSGQIGQKHTVAYGLYRFTASVDPYLAREVGYSDEDNALFLRALVNMFEHDASAARTQVNVRKVYVWTHDSDLGSAPKQRLFESVTATKNPGVEFPRQFSDYTFSVTEPPKGVKLEELVDGLAKTTTAGK